MDFQSLTLSTTAEVIQQHNKSGQWALFVPAGHTSKQPIISCLILFYSLCWYLLVTKCLNILNGSCFTDTRKAVMHRPAVFDHLSPDDWWNGKQSRFSDLSLLWFQLKKTVAWKVNKLFIYKYKQNDLNKIWAPSPIHYTVL